MQKLLKLLEHKNLYKYGVAAVLVIVPLYPKFPLFNVPGTYVAIRAEDLLLAVIASVVLFYFLRNNPQNFFEDSLNRAILIFLGVGLLSVLSGIFLTQTVSPHLALLHWARRVEYFVPFFFAFLAIRKGVNPLFFAEVLFIVAFAVFVYGWGQAHAGFPVISTQNEEFSKGLALRYIPGARLHSTFAGHYDLSAFLLFVFSVMFAIFFAIKNWGYKLLLLLAVLAPSFWLMIKTESRVSFVAYLIGVSIVLLLIRKKLFILPFLVISILLMATVGGLGDRYLYTLNVYKEKIMNMNKLMLHPGMVYAQEEAPLRQSSEKTVESTSAPIIEDRSTSIRLNVEWPRAIRAFEKNPLLGTGFSSIGLATDNDYLRLLGETGLVGFISFSLIMIRMFARFGRVFRKGFPLNSDNAFVAGFMGGALAFLINATFIDVFEASKVAITFWTLAGVAVGIVPVKTEKNG